MTWTRKRGRGSGVARALVLPVLVLIALSGDARPRALPAGGGQDPESYRISVDVALVVLHATVSDREGGFVSNLREQDFQVYEDGVPQRIRLFRYEDFPVTVGLVVDHSGSMLPKLAEVATAANTFVRLSNREDQMFVVNFNENVTLGLPEGIQFTDSPDELERAVANAPTSGMTALYAAIVKALEKLQEGSRDKKVLIVVSDGGDNASPQSLGQVMTLANHSSAVIYSIGLFDANDPDRNPRVLNRLAHATGGESFFPGPRSAVMAICKRIARDIRNQYTIGYVPTNAARNGSYRSIRVVARTTENRKLSVRTRAGYLATVEPMPAGNQGGK